MDTQMTSLALRLKPFGADADQEGERAPTESPLVVTEDVRANTTAADVLKNALEEHFPADFLLKLCNRDPRVAAAAQAGESLKVILSYGNGDETVLKIFRDGADREAAEECFENQEAVVKICVGLFGESADGTHVLIAPALLLRNLERELVQISDDGRRVSYSAIIVSNASRWMDGEKTRLLEVWESPTPGFVGRIRRISPPASSSAKQEDTSRTALEVADEALEASAVATEPTSTSSKADEDADGDEGEVPSSSQKKKSKKAVATNKKAKKKKASGAGSEDSGDEDEAEKASPRKKKKKTESKKKTTATKAVGKESKGKKAQKKVAASASSKDSDKEGGGDEGDVPKAAAPSTQKKKGKKSDDTGGAADKATSSSKSGGDASADMNEEMKRLTKEWSGLPSHLKDHFSDGLSDAEFKNLPCHLKKSIMQEASDASKESKDGSGDTVKKAPSKSKSSKATAKEDSNKSKSSKSATKKDSKKAKGSKSATKEGATATEDSDTDAQKPPAGKKLTREEEEKLKVAPQGFKFPEKIRKRFTDDMTDEEKWTMYLVYKRKNREAVAKCSAKKKAAKEALKASGDAPDTTTEDQKAQEKDDAPSSKKRKRKKKSDDEPAKKVPKKATKK